jgi:hypothetical protein
MDRCPACLDGRHGPACDGCACRCRAVLQGPFGGGDPTVPWWDERLVGVA